MLVCILSVAVLTVDAHAAVVTGPGHPYQRVVARNVFDLREPPKPEKPPPDPPPGITLTGIITIGGNKRALLKWPATSKPGAAAKEQSYILTEGQREGDVVVLEIDERAGTVKVNNHGVVQIVGFAA